MRSRGLETVVLQGRRVEIEGDPETVVYSWVFPSSSNPDTEHNLILKRDGEIFCYCPRFRFKRPGEPRSCKHFLQVRDEIEQIRQLFKIGAPLPVYEVAAPSAKAQKAAKFQPADITVGITLRTRRVIHIV